MPSPGLGMISEEPLQHGMVGVWWGMGFVGFTKKDLVTLLVCWIDQKGLALLGVLPVGVSV
jgi:hypothetical protein